MVNSRLISWYGNLTLSNFGKDVFPKLNPNDIKELQIPSDFGKYEDISSIVRKIIVVKDTDRKIDISELENEIDKMNESLPKMKHFILPGGHPAVSVTHIARCVCRRSERCCVNLKSHESTVAPLIIKYLNRLSDYLFVLARFIAHAMKVPEIIWTPRL